MAQQKTVAAPHLKVYINGAPFGIATSFNWTVVEMKKEQGGVDEQQTVEIMPTTYRINGAMGVLRLHGDGGLEGQGVTTHAADLPRKKYISILLLDRYTDQVVFSTNRAEVEMQNWGVNVRGILAGSFTFKAIGFQNEAAQ